MPLGFFERDQPKKVTPDQVKPLGRIPRGSWEELVNFHYTHLVFNSVLDTPGGLNGASRIHLKDVTHDGTSKIMEELFASEARLYEDPHNIDPKNYARRNQYYSLVAANLRQRKNFKIILQMIDTFVDVGPELPSPQRDIVTCSIANMHMLLSDSDRMLVGLRGGAYFKNIEIPSTGPNKVDNPITYIGNYYLQYIHEVGREELPLVPSRLIHPGLINRVAFPSPLPPMQDSLETAYYDPKYSINPEGATVALRGSDIRSMVMKVRGPQIWAKVATNYGEALVVIDNEQGSCLEPATMSEKGEATNGDKWINLAAVVYKDLVSEERIKVEDDDKDKDQPVEPPKIRALLGLLTKPQAPYYIYIARRNYDGKRPPRFKYEGKRRPPRVHEVTFSLPKRNMSPGHKEELERWSKETGFPIPEIPEGRTFRRPHISPKEAEDRLMELPIFIRRRIRDRMREKMEEALEKAKLRAEDYETTETVNP